MVWMFVKDIGGEMLVRGRRNGRGVQGKVKEGGTC